MPTVVFLAQNVSSTLFFSPLVSVRHLSTCHGSIALCSQVSTLRLCGVRNWKCCDNRSARAPLALSRTGLRSRACEPTSSLTLAPIRLTQNQNISATRNATRTTHVEGTGHPTTIMEQFGHELALFPASCSQNGHWQGRQGCDPHEGADRRPSHGHAYRVEGKFRVD